jgi:putative endonuclease
VNVGTQAELAAARFLSNRGLTLVTRNFRCRYGEIDLILHDRNVLVFVEVRVRNSIKFGGAAASIDAKKQGKLITTAQYYLSKLSHIPPCRFDAVLLKSPQPNTKFSDLDISFEFKDSEIEWIKNAFSA